MKNQKGLSFVEVMIILVVMTSVAVVVLVPIARIRQRSLFKEIYGVELHDKFLSGDQKQLLRPIVKSQIKALAEQVDSTRSELEGLMALPKSTDAFEVNSRLTQLERITAKLEREDKQLEKATQLAQYFGLLPDTSDQAGVK